MDKWAADDVRSVNVQIEYVLRQALVKQSMVKRVERRWWKLKKFNRRRMMVYEGHKEGLVLSIARTSKVRGRRSFLSVG